MVPFYGFHVDKYTRHMDPMDDVLRGMRKKRCDYSDRVMGFT